MAEHHGYHISEFKCLTFTSSWEIVIYDSCMTLRWVMHHCLSLKSIKSLYNVFSKPGERPLLSVKCKGSGDTSKVFKP